jgi:hypothetical protein
VPTATVLLTNSSAPGEVHSSFKSSRMPQVSLTTVLFAKARTLNQNLPSRDSFAKKVNGNRTL